MMNRRANHQAPQTLKSSDSRRIAAYTPFVVAGASTVTPVAQYATYSNRALHVYHCRVVTVRFILPRFIIWRCL